MAVQQAGRGRRLARGVLVVDGLDEARGQAFTIAEDLLRRLAAPYAVVVVATRDMHAATAATICARVAGLRETRAGEETVNYALAIGQRLDNDRSDWPKCSLLC